VPTTSQRSAVGTHLVYWSCFLKSVCVCVYLCVSVCLCVCVCACMFFLYASVCMHACIVVHLSSPMWVRNGEPLQVVYAGLKYRCSEFVRTLCKPFPIGCTSIKQLKNIAVGLLPRLLGITNSLEWIGHFPYANCQCTNVMGIKSLGKPFMLLQSIWPDNLCLHNWFPWPSIMVWVCHKPEEVGHMS